MSDSDDIEKQFPDWYVLYHSPSRYYDGIPIFWKKFPDDLWYDLSDLSEKQYEVIKYIFIPNPESKDHQLLSSTLKGISNYYKINHLAIQPYKGSSNIIFANIYLCISKPSDNTVNRYALVYKYDISLDESILELIESDLDDINMPELHKVNTLDEYISLVSNNFKSFENTFFKKKGII